MTFSDFFDRYSFPIVLGFAAFVILLLIYAFMRAESDRVERIDACINNVRAEYAGLIDGARETAATAAFMQARETAISNCYIADPKPKTDTVTIYN